jgi:hypothetical protein
MPSLIERVEQWLTSVPARNEADAILQAHVQREAEHTARVFHETHPDLEADELLARWQQEHPAPQTDLGDEAPAYHEIRQAERADEIEDELQPERREGRTDIGAYLAVQLHNRVDVIRLDWERARRRQPNPAELVNAFYLGQIEGHNYALGLVRDLHLKGDIDLHRVPSLLDPRVIQRQVEAAMEAKLEAQNEAKVHAYLQLYDLLRKWYRPLETIQVINQIVAAKPDIVPSEMLKTFLAGEWGHRSESSQNAVASAVAPQGEKVLGVERSAAETSRVVAVQEPSRTRSREVGQPIARVPNESEETVFRGVSEPGFEQPARAQTQRSNTRKMSHEQGMGVG